MKITIAKKCKDPRGRSGEWPEGRQMEVSNAFGKKLIDEGLAVSGFVKIKKDKK